MPCAYPFGFASLHTMLLLQGTVVSVRKHARPAYHCPRHQAMYVCVFYSYFPCPRMRPTMPCAYLPWLRPTVHTMPWLQGPAVSARKHARPAYHCPRHPARYACVFYSYFPCPRMRLTMPCAYPPWLRLTVHTMLWLQGPVVSARMSCAPVGVCLRHSMMCRSTYKHEL